jgi:1,4-alpha-glucan branching enzyme
VSTPGADVDARPRPDGVALVLHTHMPYVEGYGTWPSGEEWLWEAVATSYLPLLDLLEAGAPLTLSLTPVLCDQLEAPGALDRCRAFLDGIRVASHSGDAAVARADGDEPVARELERAASAYAEASAQLDGPGGDLLGRLAPYAAWTSSATHAVLPLLATDAGIRLQIRTGIDAHRARFGAWGGGFWLPECAYVPELAPLLADEGIGAVCVELTDIFGPGDPRHLHPVRAQDGPLLVPIDRALIDLVWGSRGYPSGAAYRDSHRRTANHHHPWANDGAVYDDERAQSQARADAADLVARCAERIAGGGLCVLAFDTELFGHWWHEGPAFLAAFVAEAARTGLPLRPLDEALDGVTGAAERAAAEATTTWGDPHTLWTWSNPQVGDIVVAQRAAELAVLAAGPTVPLRAVRELLALQASDWAFMVTRGLSGPYPRERHDGHRRALEGALDAVPLPDAAVRDLAPHLSIAPLLEP